MDMESPFEWSSAEEYERGKSRQDEAEVKDIIISLQHEIARDESAISRLLSAVKLAYRKHHLDDPSIGWDELSDKLMTALCETMGDQEFQKWLAKVKE